MKLRLIVAGFVLAAATLAHAGTNIVVHADRPRQEILGFGTQVWDGDPGALQFLPTLGMKWIRLNLRGVEKFNQPDLPESEYLDYMKRTIFWDRIRYLRAVRDAQKLSVVLVTFDVPACWADQERRIKPEHAASFAALWAAAVRAYADEGLKPDYIELFNEPDCKWSGGCAPETYNRIVTLVRERLDRQSLADVKIVGPGTANIDRDDDNPWVKALDDQGRAAHGAWSTHGWEWRNTDDPGHVRRSFTNGFMQSVRGIDPGMTKPIFITEFATKATGFHGVEYASQGKQYRDTTADQPAYAVRVFENALSFLNGGASVLLHWQAADQWWEDAAWGLVGRLEDSYPRRPVFAALQALFPALPVGTRVVETEQADTGPYAAAFRCPDNRLVLALVNEDKAAVRVNVVISGNRPLTLRQSRRFVDGKLATEDVARPVPCPFVADFPGISAAVFVVEDAPVVPSK